MVVDDSAVQRSHAVALCKQHGFEMIYEACNGAEALEQLAMLRLLPDMLLIDLHMPVMDGIELITHLHERDFKIPMLVVSSQQQDILDAVHELSSTLSLPLLGTLGKPLQSAQLGQVIQQFSQRVGTVHTAKPFAALPITAAELCSAIDCNRIEVHYQPKVDIRTGLVRGMEVLARWTHPELGPIAPDQFIALAEKEHLIVDLSLQVMRKAFMQSVAWSSVGFSPKLAINLSPLLLASPSIVHEINLLVQQHRIAPSQIVLEITESTGVGHLGKAIAVLTRLRLNGFGLSLDDYGTGFSSMQQLARLPFTELKIDRSFVHGAHQRQSLSVILESALDMAKRLELVSVAEGVETLEDWRLLQQYGCSIGQGFLIAKPMPASAIPIWLREHRTRLPLLRAQELAPETA